MKQRQCGGILDHSMMRNSVASPLPVQRLQVLVWGAGNPHNHFDRILAVNIQQWGYEVSLQSASLLQGAASQEGRKDTLADVLICDLDAMFRFPGLAAVDSGGMSSDEQLPPVSRARLVIAMSSRSVSRTTLERLGAVALLYKPFDMSLLQRYLEVMQKLLLAESVLADGEHRVAEREDQGQARILVVDDHAAVAETIRQCLECEPRYDVRVARDGLEALEQYITWRPRCIVTDVLMPSMNGYQVMRSLSASRSRSTPAFVVLSALPQSEQLLHYGYSPEHEIVFVEKPFLVEQLLQAVERALAQ